MQRFEGKSFVNHLHAPFTEEMQFKLLYKVITPSDIKQD